MKRDYIYIAAIAILVLFLFIQDKCNDRDKAKLRNDIAEASGMIKESDGRYSKLVTVISGNSDILKALKGSVDGLDLDGLRDDIKRNGERLLYFESAFATFRRQHDTTLIFQADQPGEWKFKLQYPDSTKPFIIYDGLISEQNRRILGDWKFNRLPLSVVLTEMPNKTWNSRIIGPDYFIVDSVVVNALPPEKIAAARRIAFVMGLGGGWNFDVNSPIFTLSAGMKIRKMSFSIMGTTRQDAQLLIQREF